MAGSTQGIARGAIEAARAKVERFRAEPSLPRDEALGLAVVVDVPERTTVDDTEAVGRTLRVGVVERVADTDTVDVLDCEEEPVARRGGALQPRAR